MTETESERVDTDGEMDTGRVLALSDGVFAIAATLLVLELQLPEGTKAEEVPDRLRELAPVFLGYVLSYVLIGLLWLGHHQQFRNFRKISGRIARMNLLFLGLVSMLPFVTSLLLYDDAAIAVQLYAATITVIFLLEALMGVIAHRLGHHADPVVGRSLAYRALSAAAVFAASIPVAAIGERGPAVAEYCWVLIIPARGVLNLARRRAAGRRGEREHAA
jgi:uncharacterized membrane protein